MSTLDAGFHSLATVLVKDVYHVFVNPAADDRRQMQLSRILILAIGLIAMGIALLMALTSDKVANSFIETQVFWISFQGLLAMVFLIGVTSCRVTAGDILRAFGVAFVVTLVTTWFYLQSRGTERPMSFLFVSIPGEIALLVAGYLPALWRKRLPPEKIAGLTLFTLGAAGTAANRQEKREPPNTPRSRVGARATPRSHHWSQKKAFARPLVASADVRRCSSGSRRW
jgi:Na+/proline symporter